MALNFKTVIESLLPSGSAWIAKSGGSFDGLIEGMSDSYLAVRNGVADIARIRDPEQTPILSDLEHEYGIIPDTSLTIAQRREVLKGIVYAKPGMGYDHLTAELHKAGFTDLFAYENNPLINPDFYINGTWSAWCGGEDSFCGGEDAYCGYDSGGGGYLLINDNTSDASQIVPEDTDTWHLVFFVGGVKSDATVGWFLLVDGDQEAATTAAWTAGPDVDTTTLSKDAVLFYEGLQSLQVQLNASASDMANYYARQEIGIDALDKDLVSAPLMHDAGAQVLYDSAFDLGDKTRLNGENGDSGDVLGLGVASGGTNAADKLAIDFTEAQLARFEGAVSDEGTFSCWAKVNDVSRAPTFDMDPGAAIGYGDLPEDLTINGTTVSPSFRYEAQDADATSWDATVGDDLPIAGSGSDPTFDALAPGPEDYRVDFKSGKYYQAASASYAQPGTDDIVLEAIIRGSTITAFELAKGSGSSSLLAFLNISGGTIYTRVNTLSVATPVSSTGWNHLIVFIDRSGSMAVYKNGVFVTSTVISTEAAVSLGSTDKWTLGALSNGTSPSDGSLAYFSMWHSPAWLDSHLQEDIAVERAMIAMGLYPSVAADGVAVDPTFKIPASTSGYAALDEDITINSVTKSPTFRYEADQATTSAWLATVGDDLAIAGSGADVVIDEYAPGLTDERVQFNAGKYYEAASADFGKPGLDDLVIELIWKHVSEIRPIASKYVSSSDRLELLALNTSMQVTINGTGLSVIPAPNTWNHAMWFLDRSGAVAGYLNGVHISSVDISAHVSNTVGSTAKWTVGARTGGTLQPLSSVAYCAMWQGAAWLDTHLQADVAAERFAKASGIWPSISQDIDGVTDGDMELSGVTNWSIGSSAVLTKSTASPHSGLQALRVTEGGSSNPYAWQDCKTANAVTHLKCWARGDGTASPTIYDPGGLGVLWAGTSSTSWQEIDLEFTNLGSTRIYFYSGAIAASGGWCEFDDITVTRSGAIPTVASRSTLAHVTKLDSSDNRLVVPVGANWMRIDEQIDESDDKLKGYLPETQATNIIPDSEGGGAWALVDAGDVATLAAATAPDGETTALSLVADATNGNHGYLHAALTLTAATWTFSCWVNPGDVDHAKLECTTVTNAYAYYNATTGTVGTIGAGCSRAKMYGPYANGEYRCEMSFTGTAAAHTVQILSCNADNDDTFAGDGGTVNSYLWCMQLEAFTKASSRVATSGASATRVKDDLRFVAGDNIGGEDVGQGTVEYSILLADFLATGFFSSFAISDGGGATDRMIQYHNAVTTYFNMPGQALFSVANDISDGDTHTLKVIFATNDIRFYIDDVLVGSDTSATIFDDIDRIDIGQSQAAVQQLCGLVSDFTIYPSAEEDYDGHLPKAFGRATESLIEKVLPGDTETALIPVGGNWMRTDRVFDKDLAPVQGYNVRPQSTNLFTYSEALDNAAWTKTNITSIDADAIIALGEQDFDGIIGDATDAIHSVEQATVTTSDYHVLSAYVKVGDKTFAYAEISEVTNGYCYYNLTSGAVSLGAGAHYAYAENKGSGIWRIWIAALVPSTAATGLIAPADSISDNTFAGDTATTNLYVFAMQIEKIDIPTTYIKTVAASATRVADILTMHAKANLGSEDPTIMTVRTEHFGTLYEGNQSRGQVVNISDGTADDRLTIASEIESIAVAVVTGGASQVLINGVLSTYTGALQVYDIEAQLNKFKLFKSRTQLDSTDTSGTMPTGLIDIDIGQRYDSTLQFNGMVGRLTISPYGLSRPRGIIGTVKTSTGQGQAIAYDDLFDGTCELRAIGDLDGEIQVSGSPVAGGLVAGTWYHVAMTWDYAASTIVLSLLANGVVVGTFSGAATDPSISGDVPMILAAAAIDTLVAGGAVSIAAPKSFSEIVDSDQIIEEYNRGTPEENHTSLISEFSSRLEDGDKGINLIGGPWLTTVGTATQALSRGWTEGGASIRFGAGVTGIESGTSKSNPFIDATSHTFEAWLRIEGSADQVVWTNSEPTGFKQSLRYNATTGKLDYLCTLGVTERTVSATIGTDRLTHVVATRSLAGGDTTMTIYLDGVSVAASTYTGAQAVIAVIDYPYYFYLGADSAADYFYGHMQGIRLYDEALDAAEVLAQHVAGQTIIETGAYATQVIIPTGETTPISGYALGELNGETDGSLDTFDFAYAVVLYKRTPSDNYRALFVGGSDSDWVQDWQPIDAIVDSCSAIRFMIKNVTHRRPSLYTEPQGIGHFDLLAGGEESPDSIVAPVDIPEEKRQILEKIVMRCKPLHTWAGMVVRYT